MKRFYKDGNWMLTAAVLVVLVCGWAIAGPQEKLVLDAPVGVEVGTRSFTQTYFAMDKEARLILVRFRECDTNGVFLVNGKVHNVRVQGYDALVGINAIETGNFSTVPFSKKLVAWLQTHGTPPYLPPGVATGSPILPTTTTTSSTTTTLP